MSLFNEIYSEVEDLRGLLCAIKVNYPDTEVRVDPAIHKIDNVLNGPTEENIYYACEDIQDLRNYLNAISKLDKELEKNTKDAVLLIDRLLGPT